MRPGLIFATLVFAVCAAVWLVGDGPGGLVYIGLYALAIVPGLPLGFRLFGMGTPAGWIAGALFGYAISAVGIWAAIAAGVPSGWTFTILCLLESAAAWLAWRRRSTPEVTLPAWTPGATAGLALVLLLALLIAVPPFARLGAADAQGNRYYRAYFTADFVWHTALTAELTKFAMPPRNPYLASEPIHYYWAYFLVPAAIAQTGPAPVRDVQRCLKLNALITGLLLTSSIFLLAWTAVGRPVPVTLAVCVALLAGSFEGTYEIYRLWSRGQDLQALRQTNIDAITAWHFQGHRIDGLPRCLWYVPQHSTAYALGLIAMTVAAAAGSAGSIGAILLAGLALGGAVAINPFVGGVFALAWGAAVALGAIRRPAPVRTLLRHSAAAIPVALALLWCIASRMVEGAGGVLEIGFSGASRHAPLVSLFLSLGPPLVLVIAGLVVNKPVPFERVAPAVALAGLSLLLMYLVRLRVDQEWVPFRAGQMFLVASPAIAGRWLSAMWDGPRRRIAAAVAALLLVLGLPTTAIDAFNAQDIENRAAGPGFHWTGVLPPEEQQAFAWIRRATPPTAVVQMEPIVRDRQSPGNNGEWWSLIPTFAERRMAAGLPISLMRIPEYRERSETVRRLFETGDANEAWTLARGLHIDYIYVDELDRGQYPGAAKFDRAPEYFRPGYRRGPVAVYQVQ